MKKNVLIFGVTILLVTLLTAGCSFTVSKDNTGYDSSNTDNLGEDINNGEKEDTNNEGITVNKISFEVLDVTTLSEELQSEIETLKLKKGFEYWKQEDGSYIVFIGSGEKSTGGYGIEVTSVEDNEGKTVISVVETEPSKDDMTIQMLIYPFVVIKASGITDNFVVLDQDGASFDKISTDDINAGEPLDDADASDPGNAAGSTMLRIDEGGIDYSKPIEGIYQGQVDDHTIEVLVGETSMTFYAKDMDTYLSDLSVGDSIEITITVSPSDQIIVDNIEKIN